MSLALAGRGNDRPLPGLPAVAGAKQEAAKKSKIPRTSHWLLHFGKSIGGHLRPTVTAAQNRAVTQLNHARILRSSERMREHKLRLAVPGFSTVTRAHQNQVAIRIGV